jgi:hypothetical protein
VELRQRQATIGKEVEVIARGGEVAGGFLRPHDSLLRSGVSYSMFEVEEHDVGECYLFLTMSNPNRVKLLNNHHRCFGCLQGSVIVNNELKECPHRRYSAICKTPDRHQLLSAPRKVYDEARFSGSWE